MLDLLRFSPTTVITYAALDKILQAVDHLIYECNKLQRERDKLIHNTSYQDKWPVGKSDLVKIHIKHFIQFANSIDLEKL